MESLPSIMPCLIPFGMSGLPATLTARELPSVICTLPTLIQLVKGRKFPDTMVRMAGRTASGGHLDAARHADSPGYFFRF